MKENRSLQISLMIKEQLSKDLSSIFFDMFPFALSEQHKNPNARDRVFTQENTLLSMIIAMTNEDKSLQQAVNIYKVIHERNKSRIEEHRRRTLYEVSQSRESGKRGRPRSTVGRIAKSKLSDISLNTSAFAQARKRLSLNYVEAVFEESLQKASSIKPSTWKDYAVYLADGTYLQMQDTEQLRSEFPVSEPNSYPRGLLEVIIEQGSGLVSAISLSGDNKSELELIAGLLEKIPNNSLLLADDLYNCYAIFGCLQNRGIEFIVPGKRVRKYKVHQRISEKDELVCISKTEHSKWLPNKEALPEKILLRRIEYEDPTSQGKAQVLYTSLINSEIDKTEIILKYATRWDIEISIREIKTIMDMNIIRSKDKTMAQKEIYACLIVYNYIRKQIMDIAYESDFSPKSDLIQKYYQADKPLYIDKLGRQYNRWSTGRKRNTETTDTEIHNTQTSE